MDEQPDSRRATTRWERIGRIAVLAAHVENLVYHVAEDLGVPRPEIRKLSGTAAADRLREVVLERGSFPPWMSEQPEHVRGWASRARGVLTRRNHVLHAIDVQVMTHNGAELRRIAVGATERVVPTTDVELDRVIRDFELVQSQGEDIRVGLAMCIRPRVYYSFWGGTVTFKYEDDEWPTEGERAAVERHLELAREWGDQIMRGVSMPALVYHSPAGLRKVPPFFFTPLSNPPGDERSQTRGT